MFRGTFGYLRSIPHISVDGSELELENVLARDEYKGGKKPWFQGSDIYHLHPVSETEFNSIKAYMEDEQIIYYTPFSEWLS